MQSIRSFLASALFATAALGCSSAPSPTTDAATPITTASESSGIDTSCDNGAGWIMGSCTEEHDIVVANNSSAALTLVFDAYYDNYCTKGHETDNVPAHMTTTLHVTFTGCTDGGGESIDSLSWTNGPSTPPNNQGVISYPSNQITCDDTGCTGARNGT